MITAPLKRPADDYARLGRATQGIELPDLHGIHATSGRYVRLESAEPDADWQVVNEYGVCKQTVSPFQDVLVQTSYKAWAEDQACKKLVDKPNFQLILRYGGALIEHLYLDPHVSFAHIERAARLCRLLIRYWHQQPPESDRDAALPALWHSYRDALAILVDARAQLLSQVAHIDDRNQRRLVYESLLGECANAWLSDWNDLSSQYVLAQRKVAAQMQVQTVQLELLIRARQRADQAYPVELWAGSLVGRGTLSIDRQALDSVIHDPAAYGQVLGLSLFEQGGLAAYHAVVKQSWESGKYPLLGLRLEAPELHELAWERLYHLWGETWQPLGITEVTPFARIVEVKATAPVNRRIQQDARKLRVLVVIASPSDLQRYNFDPIPADERQIYHQIFDSQMAELDVDYLESDTPRPPTLQNLRADLSNNYDIIHCVCHGRLRGSKYRLFLEKDDHTSKLVSSADLLTDLNTTAATPAVWFLAACQSAERPRDSDSDSFVPLGQELVARQGVSSVVAMNGLFNIATARNFTSVFYRQYLIHRHIELAMTEARRVVHDAADWSVPVLFLRTALEDRSGLLENNGST